MTILPSIVPLLFSHFTRTRLVHSHSHPSLALHSVRVVPNQKPFHSQNAWQQIQELTTLIIRSSNCQHGTSNMHENWHNQTKAESLNPCAVCSVLLVIQSPKEPRTGSMNKPLSCRVIKSQLLRGMLKFT